MLQIIKSFLNIRLLAGFTLALFIASAPASLAVAQKPSGSSTSSIGSSFNVQLAKTMVKVDNYSNYSNTSIGTLVQWADRGMATTDPLNNNVAGEMERGDRVVVTENGIFWLDIGRRAGLLSGIWPIVPGSSGASFQYLANSNEWSPNELLPGANADGTGNGVWATGQGINILGTGGSDGSCTPGVGTFVINNSDNCGIANQGVKVSLATSNSGYDHIYSFSGTMYQEGTSGDQVMTDSYGDSAKLNFKLSYDFRDYTDSTYDYGSSEGAASQRVRTMVTITPSAPIHLGTLVIAGNSDNGNAAYPYRDINYSNTARQEYGCGGLAVAAGSLATLCEGSQYTSNYITQPNTLPQTLAQGNFVSEKQTSTIGDTTDRELTYMIPYVNSYEFPERIDHIWNQPLNVSSLDADYFNNEDVGVSSGNSLNLGFDIQTVPHP